MIVAYVMAKKQGYKVSEKISWKDRLFLTLDALPSLFLIVVVIGGIVGGIFTATEGAAVAVLYSVVLSLIYKSLKIKQLSNVIKETAEISGMILFLITASALFSLVMSYTGLPEAISNGIISMTDNPIALLL
ncbi:TRAP transporter large permease subunit, partial [Staphylococcus warneri]